MRRTLGLNLAVAAWSSLCAQSFDVASVKRNPAGYGPTTRMNETTGRVGFIGVPLKWLIRRAYQVQDSQISGPEWLDSEGYDIAATFPPGIPSRERNAMWQTLLAERFKLVLHRETRDVPAYLLFPALRAAVEAQLGLKLVPKKTSREILIVDHAEKVPTEN
jgi:hypothetical protein